MTRIQGKSSIKIEDTSSVIAFGRHGGEWGKHRMILIEGKPAYEIGSICGSCRFYFERLEGAAQSVNPSEIIEQLNSGMNCLDEKLVQTVSRMMPEGKYKVLLLRIYPKLIRLGSEADYFFNEQIKLWGTDSFWGIPHNPKIPYYRGTDQRMEEGERLFEFIVPIFPQSWLDLKRVNEYKKEIENGNTPVAIGLSVLDLKTPFIWDKEKRESLVKHWCFAHYIIDGHHKVFAASQLNKPLDLLCFLTREESFLENEGDIDMLIRNL